MHANDRPLTWTAMTPEFAQEIAAWRYESPYDFYDADADPEDLEELLDPAKWAQIFQACLTGTDLTGFFTAEVRPADRGSEAEIGLGMRPDLTGRGRGHDFLHQVLNRLSKLVPDLTVVSLSVGDFNQRAIKVYEAVGFQVTGSHVQQTNGGSYRFIDMTRELSTRL